MKIKKILLPIALLVAQSLYAEENLNYEIMNTMYAKHFSKELPRLSEVSDKRIEPTLFMFTSSSVPQKTVDNFLKRGELLNITSYVVYRGLDNNVKKILINADKKKEKVLAKVHPIMFTELQIEKVPVIVYADCPDKDHFRYKKCDFQYRMDGDASLNEFFERVSELEPKLEKYEEILNGLK